MSYLTFDEFLASPQNVRTTLVDRTNFLACYAGRVCTICGCQLTAYSTKLVNILTCEINCGHDELYKEDGTLHENWVGYTDG